MVEMHGRLKLMSFVVDIFVPRKHSLAQRAVSIRGLAGLSSLFIPGNQERVMQRRANCRTGGVKSENQPQRGWFLSGLPPTTPKSGRLPRCCMFRLNRVAAMLLGVLCWGVSLSDVRSASGRHDTGGASIEKSSSSPDLPDPMEMVREQLKENLKKRPHSDRVSSDPMTPEDVEMEQLRIRLVRRLSMPNELHLSLRSPPPASAINAARRAAHASKGQGSASASGTKPSSGTDSWAAKAAELTWAYQGHKGPDAWAGISPKFALCNSGKRQSPIDLRNGIQAHLEPLVFEYQSSELKVQDDGRGVYVKVGPGNLLNLRGRRYELQSIRFHTPAQEHIEGQIYDMSAELLHRDPDDHRLVVVVMFQKGETHPGVQLVLNHLPLDSNEEVTIRQPIDWSLWWPPEYGYYIYMGSLTEPPCTEGVLRVVMKTPATVSTEQLAAFSRIHPMNVRPIQPMAGRLLKETN